MLLRANKHIINKEYSLKLEDANGLEIGSPVKVLGVHAGYVEDIKLKEDEVEIKFLITRGKINFPQCSKASVLSSSLGGSRYLNIESPDNNFSCGDKTFYVVKTFKPSRKNDEKISEAVVLGMEGVASIIELTALPEDKAKAKNSEKTQFLKNDIIDLNKKINITSSSFRKNIVFAKEDLRKIDKSTENLAKLSNLDISAKNINKVRDISDKTETLSKDFSNKKIKQTNEKIVVFDKNVKTVTNIHLVRFIKEFSNSVELINKKINDVKASQEDL